MIIISYTVAPLYAQVTCPKTYRRQLKLERSQPSADDIFLMIFMYLHMVIGKLQPITHYWH